ncbi:MAG: N-acetylglucosamine-6-phosphate deacetylase [Oscillospiraceae bacterium]|nr:N-acetylglucosamine-6-phosphate deacetylase [Oscillospiraceae bacterium]
MIISNGLVYGQDYTFGKADIAFEGSTITQIAPPGSLLGDGVDADGAYVLPGFVDIHTHGCMNSDFCDADPSGLEKMLSCYGKSGVTSVVPATMAYGEEVLTGIVKAALPYIDKYGFGAALRGINMEGPFLNVEKRGAQNAENIIAPDIGIFDRLYALSGGSIRLLDIAPETPGAMELIRHASRKCAVSIAHTSANYNTAIIAFDAGASHVTHLFNAMPPFYHREPGVIGAAADLAAYVEIISDGVHLHPSVVRASFKLFGVSRICLVSDSMRGAGMPNGEYDLGGQPVILKDGRANLKHGGAIAGSAMNLADCCRSAVDFGIPLEDAIRASSTNPAKAVGLDSKVGSLEVGKNADILIWNNDLSARAVFSGGERL